MASETDRVTGTLVMIEGISEKNGRLVRLSVDVPYPEGKEAFVWLHESVTIALASSPVPTERD